MRPDGPVLGFDTSAAHCAAGLFLAGAPGPSRFEAMPKGQAERLMPMLEVVLAEAGIGWRDLAGIGVGTGPGNFTGIRIAVSAARGLALGLGVPAVGISGFDVLAAGRGADLPLLASLPAPRGAAYVQLLETSGERSAPTVLVPGEAAADLTRPGLKVIGHASAAIAAALRAEALVTAPTDLGTAIAALAAERLALGPSDIARPAPLYVSPADAAPAPPPPPVIPA